MRRRLKVNRNYVLVNMLRPIHCCTSDTDQVRGARYAGRGCPTLPQPLITTDETDRRTRLTRFPSPQPEPRIPCSAFPVSVPEPPVTADLLPQDTSGASSNG